jgi:catechol 2,3-dioxygenase-like lactoylglutathione lyase family enzyme
MLHHLALWVPDLGRAEESWSWLLGRLGYERDPAVGDKLLFRHPTFTVVLEQSSDMVPGMLYSRFRPGLNHLAFRVERDVSLAELVAEASHHGWSPMSNNGAHLIAGGADVAYLEDRDGFEVELVC